MRGIEAANQKHLYGVFGDSQWTNKDRLPGVLLKDLIEHFSAINLRNQNVTTDIIGDGYEYLIKKFADATNKKAGEFYTPRSVVRLLVDILDLQEGETIYDPACGTGGMLLGAVEHVCAKGGDPRAFFGKLYGQEKNLTTASVVRMNLLLHGMEDFIVERGDTLRNPVFTDPSTGGIATFDCVIANPPFSLEQWGREIWESDPWGRSLLYWKIRRIQSSNGTAKHGPVTRGDVTSSAHHRMDVRTMLSFSTSSKAWMAKQVAVPFSSHMEFCSARKKPTCARNWWTPTL